jgi:hypothetical protein
MSYFNMICYSLFNIVVRCIEWILNKNLVDSYWFINNTFYIWNKNLVKAVKIIVFYLLELKTIDFKRLVFCTLK